MNIMAFVLAAGVATGAAQQPTQEKDIQQAISTLLSSSALSKDFDGKLEKDNVTVTYFANHEVWIEVKTDNKNVGYNFMEGKITGIGHNFKSALEDLRRRAMRVMGAAGQHS